MIEPIRLYQEDDDSTPIIENCSICLDDLNSNPIHEIQECKHKFHSSCLITWLRVNNGCPICRSITPISAFDRRTEGSILRHILNFCKSKKNKSNKLKKMYLKYKKLSDNYTLKKKEKMEFCKLNKDVLKKYKKINNDLWRSRRKFSDIKNSMSTLPIYFINQK